MEYLKYILIGIFTVFVAYITLCLFTPSQVIISQSIIVNAPVDSVFKRVSSVESWPTWHPWFRKMESNAYSINSQQPSISWTTESKKGGRIDIVGSSTNSSIQTELVYEKDEYSKVNQGEFLFENVEGRTKVSWILVGTEYPFLLKPSTILLKQVFSTNYEIGLKNLKALCEGMPLPQKRRIDE